ncbi:hypothetical protein XI06_17025 [Bradyrhizobium sp. CCBAU 11434]|uniref:hypothetical protein n=1 Tax=Bradyrhizobium sp. CCBAU 11434 TaxID=1630885 RepID=UPI0023065B37|nr:hypothetical protein [Bradyrhizobium sp. CCBAU 11434]MDA9521963.1 hypothetical protein [Bradyrhizobium sp. CCBAU 11434]
MVDIIGPANAPNSVTSRPDDTRTFGSLDSWFKDCTSATANDGTKLTAAFMNAVAGLFRSAIRGNGLTALSAPVVAEDNSDDMLLHAMQQMVQRGQPKYGDDTGSANHVVVAPTPAAIELKKGMEVITKLAATNLGPGDLNLSGLGPVAIKRLDGTDLQANDLLIGQIGRFVFDGIFWQLTNGQQNVIKVLTANTTFYVDASLGSDTLYDGTAAVVSGVHGPFRTIQRAVNEAFKFGPSAAYIITVKVADGTYAESVATPTIPGPAIVVDGNSGTPSNVHINSSTSNAFSVNGPNTATLKNLKWSATALNTAGAAANGAGANLFTANTESGTCGGWCFLGNGGGAVSIGAHKFNANVAFAFACYRNGTINLGTGISFTIAAAITVSAFAAVVSGGQIEVPATGTPTFVNPGNVTGAKYLGSLNGVINAQGAGVNYFPGNSAGSLSSGAQYG